MFTIKVLLKKTKYFSCITKHKVLRSVCNFLQFRLSSTLLFKKLLKRWNQ